MKVAYGCRGSTATMLMPCGAFSPSVANAALERFKAIVRKIDRVSKRGDHGRALAMLPELLAVEPNVSRYSKKKAHFIAALAYRALQGGDRRVALAFLDVADRELPDEHMSPFLLEERANIRRAAAAATSDTRASHTAETERSA